MRYIAEKLGSHEFMRNFFAEHICNVTALIAGLMIGAFLKMLFF